MRIYRTKLAYHLQTIGWPEGAVPLECRWYSFDRKPPNDKAFLWVSTTGKDVHLGYYFPKEMRFLSTATFALTGARTPACIEGVRYWQVLPRHPTYCGGPGNPEFDKWIPPKNRVPEEADLCVVAVTERLRVLPVTYGGFRGYKNKKFVWNLVYPMVQVPKRLPMPWHVTHWRPKPLPPEGQ